MELASRFHSTPAPSMYYIQPEWHSLSSSSYLWDRDATLLSLPLVGLVQKFLYHSCSSTDKGWDCARTKVALSQGSSRVYRRMKETNPPVNAGCRKGWLKMASGLLSSSRKKYLVGLLSPDKDRQKSPYTLHLLWKISWRKLYLTWAPLGEKSTCCKFCDSQTAL